MDNQSVVVPMEAAQLLPPQTKRSSLERLRLAARQLFVEDGYDKTRPQDIARLAGLANGTFYLHFKDKKAAFLDFSERAQSDLIQELRVGLDGITGREHRWRVIFAVMETFSERHPGVLEAAFMDPVMIAPNDEQAWRLYDRISGFVLAALTERREDMATDYDLELISHAICGMLRHAMTFASRVGMEKEKMINDLITFIEKGLYQ